MKHGIRPVTALALLAMLACEPESTSPRQIPTPSNNIVLGSGTFSAIAAIPTPRAEASGAALNGHFYVAGGVDGSHNPLDVVERYNPDHDSWTGVASLPNTKSDFGLVSLGGFLYAVGGQGNTMYRYSPATNSWSAPLPSPTPHTNFFGMAATAGGLLYFLGGSTVTIGVTDAVSSYDPNTNTWTPRAPMPKKLQEAAATGVNGQVCVAGGYDDIGQPNIDLYCYDPGSDTWNTLSAPSHERAFPGLTSVAGNLYLTGGGSLSPQGFNTVTDEWIDVGTDFPLTSQATAAIGNTIYFAGGSATLGDPPVSSAAKLEVAFAGNHAPQPVSGCPCSGQEGIEMSFSNQTGSTDVDGDPLTISWDFGDGGTATGVSTTHTYAHPGSYTLRLTATDTTGLSRREATTVSISNVTPVVNVAAVDTILKLETYDFAGSFTDPGTDTWSATVDYDDGSGRETLPLADHSFELNHQYTHAIRHIVNVRVYDGRATGTARVFVYVLGEQAALAVLETRVSQEALNGRAPLMLTFLNSARQLVATDRLSAVIQLLQFEDKVNYEISRGNVSPDDGVGLLAFSTRIRALLIPPV